ncbi:unnamed protein product [Colias eurytheme]|nr:unnamed protein product [Colias eurytheme]
MWKYVTRRLRDSLERSANHFDKRSCGGVVNSSNGLSDDVNKRSNTPCCWFTSRKPWNSYQNDNDTNSKRWNFDNLNCTWIGAITWSSALVFGWYSGQLIHWKLKDHFKQTKCTPTNTLLESFQPIKNRNIKSLEAGYEVHTAKASTVHLISNDHSGDKQENASASKNSSESSDGDLGEVLNSIENKLGLAAIESGHHQDGLNLLRSAANRNHPPALYNLGLCYELGLGVEADEKAAMELYRSAAALQHPGALYNLGIYYAQARGGLNRDTTTATRLLRLAAVQGQEDAITALKNLDVDINEPAPQGDNDLWSKQFSQFSHNENIIPTLSSLFIENLNNNLGFNYEPVVY